MAWSTEFSKPVCSVENCRKPIRSKGFCTIHYQRMYVQGRTERVKQTRDGPCLVEDCEEVVKGLGYCNKHYQLFKRNGSPDKLVKTARKHPLYIVWFEKKQNKRLCEEWMVFKTFCEGVGERPEGNFILIRPDQTKPYGSDNFQWYSHLKKEENEPDKDWHARKWADARIRNPDIEYERNLQRNYGISLEEYNQKLIAQNYVCAMCKKPESVVNGYSKTVKRLAVDHCHASGNIRDLLCNRCNTMIGLANDEIEILEAGIVYIKSHKEN